MPDATCGKLSTVLSAAPLGLRSSRASEMPTAFMENPMDRGPAEMGVSTASEKREKHKQKQHLWQLHHHQLDSGLRMHTCWLPQTASLPITRVERNLKRAFRISFVRRHTSQLKAAQTSCRVRCDTPGGMLLREFWGGLVRVCVRNMRPIHHLQALQPRCIMPKPPVLLAHGPSAYTFLTIQLLQCTAKETQDDTIPSC